MTGRPTVIEILGQPFTVRWEDQQGVRLHPDSDGHFDLGTNAVDTQQIVIRSLQGEHQLRDTVLHEILHVLVKMTGHRDHFKSEAEPHPEEPVVMALGGALLQVLRSNPPLVEWLTARLGSLEDSDGS